MDEYTILKKKKQKNGFATTAILAAIAFVLLALVLFLFLMGKADKSKSIVNANGGNTGTEKISNKSKDSNDISEESETCVSGSKEHIFNENLRTIKDAAVSYFTTERLPVKIGDTKKLTLKEMQDKKLVLSMVDSKGKVCGADTSYVEVTKEKTEYTMKINLSCSDMEDYIIIHLGCYDYCKGNVCEKQIDDVTEFEYEYKKTTNCTMSGWSSWSSWKTTREKTSDLKKEDTKVVTTYQTITDTKDAIKEPTTYNCNKYGKDYKLDGKYCVKETLTKEVIDATPSNYSYKCTEGYTLNGSKCEKTITNIDKKNAIVNPDKYTCASYSGYTLNTKTNKCEKDVKVIEKKDALEEAATYNCNAYPGYTLKGTSCVKTITDTKDAAENATKYNCNAYPGYTLSGTNCVKKVTDTKDAAKNTTTYNCNAYPGYTLSGTDCVKEEKINTPVDRIPVYDTRKVNKTVSCNKQKCTTKTVMNAKGQMVPQTSCETVKSKCDKEVEEIYVSGYTCPATMVNGSCVKVTTTKDTKPATANATTYNCNAYSGYTLNGTKCEKTITDTKKATEEPTTYNCNAYPGYTLNGTKCTKTVTDTKSATKNPTVYTCSTYGKDYKLSGTTCVKEYNLTLEEKAIKEATTYNCDKYGKDYKLSGTTCVKETKEIESLNATRVSGGYICKDGYTLNGTKCEKTIINKDTKNATEVVGNTTCLSGYKLDGNKCTKTTSQEVKTTYYRYATRSCTGGSTDTVWSVKDDKSLINDGYKQTGNKRAITVNEK